MPPAESASGLSSRRLVAGAAVFTSLVTTSKFFRDCSTVHPASVAGVSSVKRTLVCQVWHITQAAMPGNRAAAIGHEHPFDGVAVRIDVGSGREPGLLCGYRRRGRRRQAHGKQHARGGQQECLDHTSSYCCPLAVVVGLTRSSGRIAVLMRAGRAPVLIFATIASFFRSTAIV